MIKKNQIVRTEITEVNNLGYGICRVDGKVTFVAQACDGDICDVKIIKTAQSYNVARLEQLITPSEYRTESGCEVSKRCGGCAYRHISYEHELEIKRGYIISAMKKNKIDVEVGNVLHGLSDGYRNKVQYPVSPDGKIGFYAPRSHDIIECGVCPLQCRALDGITEFIRAHLKKHGAGGIRHIYLRHATATGENIVTIIAHGELYGANAALPANIMAAFPSCCGVVLNINDEDTNVILGERSVVLAGRGYMEDILCGLHFRISPKAFYQVNHDMAQVLYGEVVTRAKTAAAVLGGGRLRICDLFCGIGTIGLTVASQIPGSELYGVEIVPEAVEDAKINAKLNNIDAEFECIDCSDAASLTGKALVGRDLIICDPPRSGMDAELVQAICKSGAPYVIYVSCSPDTLARDLALMSGSYARSEITPVDMFPRTGHVETCVLLSHKNS